MATTRVVLTTSLAAGDYLRHDGTAFTNFPFQRMIVEDQKANTTVGGTPTVGLTTATAHDLNTIVSNTIVGAGLANNTVTLPPGSYIIDCAMTIAPTNEVRFRFRNITDSADAVVSPSMYGYPSHGMGFNAWASGMAVIAPGSSKDFQLQYWIGGAGAGSSTLGYAVSSGSLERYAQVIITRV
jgi:hypothetical protein